MLETIRPAANSPEEEFNLRLKCAYSMTPIAPWFAYMCLFAETA